MNKMMVVSVLVKNRQGALMRVSNVFTRRGINIKQISASQIIDENITKITILIYNEQDLDHKQVDKQLRKIEYVTSAKILPYIDTISKELLLIKIAYQEENLDTIQDKLFRYSGNVVRFDKQTLVGQIVAKTEKIDEFLQEIHEFNILDISRSGVMSLELDND